MTDEGCSWRAWRTTIEWSDLSLAAEIRDRLQTFSGVLIANVKRLAQGLSGAMDIDVIAILGLQLMRAGQATDTDLDASVLVVADEALRKAHAGRLFACAIGIRAWREHASGPMAYLATAVLLHRALLTTVANQPAAWDDPEVLCAAADALEGQVQGAITFVSWGDIAANDYRVM